MMDQKRDKILDVFSVISELIIQSFTYYLQQTIFVYMLKLVQIKKK